MAASPPRFCPACGVSLAAHGGVGQRACPVCGERLAVASAPWVGGALLVLGLAFLGVAGAGVLVVRAPAPAPDPAPRGVEAPRAAPVPIPEAVPIPTAAPNPLSVDLSNPEPNYFADAEAAAGVLARLHDATDVTGRLRFLVFDGTRSVVAIAEVGPGALDSVVFSWGRVVVHPVPLDETERAEIEGQLFTVDAGQLRRLPGVIADAIAAESGDVTVERVTLLALGGAPRVEVSRSHPRRVLEPWVVPLADLR